MELTFLEQKVHETHCCSSGSDYKYMKYQMPQILDVHASVKYIKKIENLNSTNQQLHQKIEFWK